MLSHQSGENSAKQALLRHAQTTAVAAEMGFSRDGVYFFSPSISALGGTFAQAA
jgi:hypothetical protein